MRPTPKPFTDEEYIHEMIETRRTLHRIPEEAWAEFETSWIVTERLRSLGFRVLLGRDIINPHAVMGRDPERVEAAIERALANGVPERFIEETDGFTGVVGILDTGRPGPVTAFRADMDCVQVDETKDPQHESNLCGFSSEHPGLMHACGHDAHTAIGLEVARWLIDHENELVGTFKLIFQPAEEELCGAAAMAASGILDDVSNLVGSHVGLLAKPGEVLLVSGGFPASTKIDVHFEGLPSHAGSDPEKGRSALMAACSAAMMVQGISRHGGGESRICVGKLNAGEGRNVTPVHADMQIEVRGTSDEVNDFVVSNVNNVIAGIGLAYGVKTNSIRAGEACTLPVCRRLVNIVLEEARDVPGVLRVDIESRPTVPEDCATLIRRVVHHGGRGAFFLFGCNHHGHHLSNFEIQDTESMPLGFGVFTRVAKRLNGAGYAANY